MGRSAQRARDRASDLRADLRGTAPDINTSDGAPKTVEVRNNRLQHALLAGSGNQADFELAGQLIRPDSGKALRPNLFRVLRRRGFIQRLSSPPDESESMGSARKLARCDFGTAPTAVLCGFHARARSECGGVEDSIVGQEIEWTRFY